ncbi:MAG: proline iminopeptidase-family hydrolase [Sediminibacterium sp. Gen4]|jgi:proline iminopeptidase|uniref:proline iminopeptidase-family hydrolase n=1 Tax=unclassified Sediminibacterium TaxID=2635961 RepID=UPI0015BB11E0|nr:MULTISPECIES: proline iminopeptidase-family hydrolase [unclassified Sediminibacterium]MBW0162623.1 proline iminopeptidase-family hydrolase [Sediminibacterium sp.]MBW0163258.1 proline iminopeptidase-family hydrolase [Sediminibacterium sp.]MDZ4073011.1 proline iminopeptidase-family hydrolase [Sediminibacterium sp.]NWK66155.1 proline iminopeptidase-family hydrolase [Sediminibacterium sp. Gen4]
MRILFALLSFVFIVSCQQKSTTVQEYFATKDSGVQVAGIKMIPIKTDVGTFKVWTKTIGNNPRVKVLLLHGGPAMTHEYMEAFESFFPKEGFEIIEYDQLGSYYSDQPTDSSLWTTERFVEEVEQVRTALGLTKDNFYILGNSWGGILAMEYALKYQQNLKGLIICNMMASIPDYEKYNGVLRSRMRPSLVDSLQQYEAKGLFKDPTYQELVFNEYYTKHLCRLPEWPEPVNRCFKHINESIYVMMQGPSEFKVGGRLLTWDRKADLPKITVPTLTVGAKYDTMDPAHMEWMSKQVQNGKYLYCPNGSHLSMWDDQQVFMDGVIKFIKETDAGK